MKNEVDTSKDEKFIQKLEQIVHENLQNEQFGVETLAKLKGISRSHLHRKLRFLKKKSVSRFIREIRLTEAMKMLQKDVANVSEIAYSVGFSSTSYFNTCFHDYYGYPPGEVKKRNQNESNAMAHEVIESNDRQPINIHPITAIKRDLKAKKQSVSKKSLRLITLLIMGMLLIVILSVIYFMYISGNSQLVAPPKSIAILPLEHLSDSPDQEYLTAGIHDALIGELGMIKGLRVISRTSTLRYPESNLLIAEIARELGVEVIVEGSVLITGDTLRLQLQLIEAFPEERHIWAQEYYRDIPNVLTLQSKVIEDIAKTIEVRLSVEEKKHLASVRKVNTESYKAYLRGIYFINKSTSVEFQKGLEYLHEAIEYDPADPLAYAGLAEGYLTLGHGPDPSNTYWQRGKAAALRAIELDSALASGYAALGAIKLYYEGDWEGAENNFIKANAINPNLGWTHFHYAWYHVLMGQMDKALIEQKLSQELDPLTPMITADLGSLYYFLGRYDEAIIELKQALELDKDYGHAWWMLGNVYLRKGLTDEAIVAHSRAVEINPVWKWALANTYILTKKEDKALPIISELKSNAISSRIAYGLCRIYTSLGDLDEAFYWLEYQTPDVWVPWIRTSPGFEPLRE